MAKKTVVARMQAIRALLIADWAPIGYGVPPDEYDGYLPGIYRLLESGTDVVKLTAHFGKLERISMGLAERTDHNRHVAEKLIELGKQLFGPRLPGAVSRYE
jgi:hypothetical protein